MSHTTGHASPLSDFDIAARALGHDPGTVTGASDARADHRVWDRLDRAARHLALDELIDEALVEATAALNGHAPTTVAHHIHTARKAIRTAGER
jgi:hypothetical protein